MNRLMTFARRFAGDRSGATAIEYGLIGVLIGVAVIGGASLLGQNVSAKLDTTNEAVSGAFGGGDD